jgi:hypothetical protein
VRQELFNFEACTKESVLYPLPFKKSERYLNLSRFEVPSVALTKKGNWLHVCYSQLTIYRPNDHPGIGKRVSIVDRSAVGKVEDSYPVHMT